MLCAAGEYANRCGPGKCTGPGHTEDNDYEEYEIAGVIYYRYPRHLIWAETWDWIEVRHMYNDKIMPVAGGWLDQTAKFVKAMSLISSEVAQKK